MRIIKSQQDFNCLRRAGVLPVALLDQVEDYFNQLKVEQEDEDSCEFRLNECGYIVVLEAGDNIRDLGNVGLNRIDGGLLGSCPEYVELLDAGEGLQAYKIAVLYDNDYLMTFFTQAGAHDEEVEQWLTDQAERTCSTSLTPFSSFGERKGRPNRHRRESPAQSSIQRSVI